MTLTPTETLIDSPTHAPSGLSAQTEGRAIDLLHSLVALPSVSGNERLATELLTTRMREMGMTAHIDKAGNAVGEIGPPAGPGVREILLLGHIDTVPGDIRVRREGDLLFGRGSVDAKGPLAAFVIAAATAELAPRTRVVVIGAVEEETPTSRGARFVAGRTAPYACLIGEPSGCDGVVLGYKGRLLLEVSAATSSAHSAGPGVNAAELGAAWWQDIRQMAAEFNVGRERAFDQLQARLRSFQAADDGLEERAVMLIGFRLPTDLSPDHLEARVRRLRVARGATALQLRFAGHEEAVLSERTNPAARALSVAIREGGRVPRPTVKTGTSDMNVVGPVWRCPIVAYGPGDSSLDHTPHEHISIAEYLRSIEVLQRALNGLSTQER